MRLAALCFLLCTSAFAVAAAPLDAIDVPLTPTAGNPARGRALVADRQKGMCLLCHTAPIAEVRQQGDLAPSLAGAGARWSAAQLRARVVDNRRINPQSIMPAYFKVEGLHRVGAPWKDKTLLGAQEIEDVVAYLATLK
ncbi:MAG: sulfur oxidation c-type cytochrome SoxX [Betaproteobacteria bacterium]|nr:sulfur oxidation c-type cytochrome SoxX [Betaproteobacteria bacterium]